VAEAPDRIDVTKLVAPAAKAGVVFNPGPEWSCNPSATKSHLRLCFALPSKDDIRAGVAAFARVCFEETGIPERAPTSAAPRRLKSPAASRRARPPSLLSRRKIDLTPKSPHPIVNNKKEIKWLRARNGVLRAGRAGRCVL